MAGIFRLRSRAPWQQRRLAPPVAGEAPAAGPVPVWQAASVLAGATAANGTVPTLNAVADDVVVVFYFLEPSQAVTPPDGTWTEEATAATTGTRLRMFWHRAAGSEAGGYAFTHASTFRKAWALRISGCVTTGNPWDAPVDIEFDNAVAATTVNVAVTTLAANRLLVWAATLVSGSSTFTAPAGLTERHNAESTGTTATGDFLTQGATGALSGACGSSAERIAFLGALKPVPAAGGGQTIAAGHAVEAETGQAIGRAKARATAEAVEAETAQAITPHKARALTGATEVEAAQALGRLKSRAVGEAIEAEAGQAITVDQPGPQIIPVGQAAETEAAQAIVPRKTRSLGQATEAESGQGIGRAKTRAVTQAAEAETGQALGRAKARAVTQASEPEAGQAIGRRKTAPLSPAVEAETAPTINLLGVQIIPVGRAIEAETAPAIGRGKLRVLGHAAEVEAGQALARLKLRTLGPALEAEAALVVAVAGGLPPPRWVEGAGGGSGAVEAAAGGSGQVEQAGAASGVIEATGGV